MNRLLLACVACVAALAPSLSPAATFEVPGDGGHASGIGYFSGWKCPPNDKVTIVIDGGVPIPVASGIRRGDTASACGNSGLNGYISEINFGNLGAGSHHASVRQNAAEFAGGTFTVTTFGGAFLSGAAATYVLQDFPSTGKTATVQWSEGAQNFVITGTGGGSPSGQCPASGPIKDLRADCSDDLFFYTKGLGAAGLTSDGGSVTICLAAVGTPDVVCLTGPVTGATTFGLTLGDVNAGPFSPLDPGSGGNIAGNGQTLNFVVIIDGDSTPFQGLAYNHREPLSAAATESDIGGAVNQLRDALRALDTAGAGSQSIGDTGAMSQALREMLERLGQ